MKHCFAPTLINGLFLSLLHKYIIPESLANWQESKQSQTVFPIISVKAEVSHKCLVYVFSYMQLQNKPTYIACVENLRFPKSDHDEVNRQVCF